MTKDRNVPHTCKICKITKEPNEFPANTLSRCKQCTREIYYKKMEIARSQKTSVACKSCGEAKIFPDDFYGLMKRCKACYRNIENTRFQERKIEEKKKGIIKCNSCGLETDNFISGRTVCRPCNNLRNLKALERWRNGGENITCRDCQRPVGLDSTQKYRCRLCVNLKAAMRQRKSKQKKKILDIGKTAEEEPDIIQEIVIDSVMA